MSQLPKLSWREIAERKRAEQEREKNRQLIQEQNEELQSVNEELQAINEELQTTTEDLIEAQHELTEGKRLSDALNDINAAINSTLEINEIIQRVVAGSAIAIGSETATVNLREGDDWVVAYAYGFSNKVVGIRYGEEGKVTRTVAATKKPLVISDAYNDKDANPDLMKEYGIRSVLAVPIIIKGEVIGVLVFGNLSSPLVFSYAQVDFATKLAASVSLAMENARLYEAECYIANTLQGAILTMPERIEGIEFGHLYRSATETARVGGDFYDIFELEHDRVGVIIGDVSGKGIKAAALTSLAKNTIRAYAHVEKLPSAILTKANSAIIQTAPKGNFITLFLGIIDMRSGKLLYCSAGHPSVLLKRKMAGVELLEVSSPIIGAFDGMDYMDSATSIEAGDILFLYTDGITEARCNNDFFKEERLVESLENLDPISAKDVPHTVFSTVMEFTGGQLSDDVALLSLELT